jgi:hypothetical protein
MATSRPLCAIRLWPLFLFFCFFHTCNMYSVHVQKAIMNSKYDTYLTCYLPIAGSSTTHYRVNPQGTPANACTHMHAHACTHAFTRTCTCLRTCIRTEHTHTHNCTHSRCKTWKNCCLRNFIKMKMAVLWKLMNENEEKIKDEKNDR